MPKETNKKIIDVWGFAKVNLQAQFLGNMFFGMPLVVINCLNQGYSPEVVFKICLFYFVIYLFVFVPFYAVLSYFFLRPVLATFKKIDKGQEVDSKEINKTISFLLDLPDKICIAVFLSVQPAFILGALSFRTGFIPELIPIVNIVIGVAIGIGVVVGGIHAFLVYILSENYLRAAVEFLVSLKKVRVADLKMIKRPLFRKVLLLVLITVGACQLSLAISFLGKIAIDIPEIFEKMFFYVLITIILNSIFVFIIATSFVRNLTYPLNRLTGWAERIIRGDFDQDINVMTNDELANVIEYLKDMVKNLKGSRVDLEVKVKDRTRELKELTNSLEDQVKTRTNELEERLEELERFNRLTVDRELKMAELKNEISRLEGIIGEKKDKS